MSTLTVFNQTVTDLLPARKPVPTARPESVDKPEFERQLKDAGERYSRPEQTVDKTTDVQPVDDAPAPEQATTTTETDTKVEPKQDANEPKTDQGEAVETTEDSAPTQSTSEPVAETEVPTEQPVATDAATQAAAAAAQAQALLAQQQAVDPSTQSTTAQPVVTDQTAQVQQGEQTQQVVTQSTQSAQSTTQTPSQQAAEAAANQLATGPVQPQPQQQKDAQQLANTDTSTQDKPSATAERIAVVAEARQQSDAKQSGTNDSTQQDQGALKANSQAVQSQTTQNLTPTAQTTAANINVAASAPAPITGEAQVTSASPTAQAAPSTQTQDASNTQLNTARIARGLQNAVQQKGGAVTLRLTPPEMGMVRIQLQMQSGTVNAQFHAETESTRTLLSQQMSQLRSSLEQQGLTVDRLGVQTMNQTSGSNLHNESQSDRDGQPNDGRSRGGFTRQGDNQQQRQNPDEPSLFDQELTTAA